MFIGATAPYHYAPLAPARRVLRCLDTAEHYDNACEASTAASRAGGARIRQWIHVHPSSCTLSTALAWRPVGLFDMTRPPCRHERPAHPPIGLPRRLSKTCVRCRAHPSNTERATADTPAERCAAAVGKQPEPEHARTRTRRRSHPRAAAALRTAAVPRPHPGGALCAAALRAVADDVRSAPCCAPGRGSFPGGRARPPRVYEAQAGAAHCLCSHWPYEPNGR